MRRALRGFEQNVFINCPFDGQYQSLFDAIVFAVQIAGFKPRCALEASNAGCRRYGAGSLGSKKLLVLDKSPYRYQKFISDIAGQDIISHDNSSKRIIRQIRDWLATESKNATIPGGAYMFGRYRAFRRAFPVLCEKMKLTPGQLTFGDFSAILRIWLEEKET